MTVNDAFDALAISPVPDPNKTVEPPELFRGIYGMPMHATIETTRLEEETRFWCDGLGFFVLFHVPGVMVHVRRWAFQDVLLVASPEREAISDDGRNPDQGEVTPHPGFALSFACTISQVDGLAQNCEAAKPECTTGAVDTQWNTRDLAVTTPSGAAVVMTAAKPRSALNDLEFQGR